MRIAKLILTLSLSVFLLSVSWTLLTGQLALPRFAHAQTTDPFVAMQQDHHNEDYFFCLSASGEFWRVSETGLSNNNPPYFLGTVRDGGAVPVTDETTGGLKSRYGGN